MSHPMDNQPCSIAPFQPRRAASWWSVAEDLLWPEKRARDKIKRRADALAEAGVDTVIQFGFHYRFDFAWHFGAMHGLFAEIADALHQRNIKFLDHYSCNVIARPRSEEDRVNYHSFNRHTVNLYPDAVAAETAGYAGYRFNDLREIDLLTGQPAYCSQYEGEMFCHNNPDFLAMHAAYLRRLFSEVALDGVQADDMCLYGCFRSCGCRHCRDRFRRECGHELPPLSDRTFWGDTSISPGMWGNYENAAFRAWVRMRYRYVAEHVANVKRIIGPNRVLMTCCSSSGPQVLNSLALSYENMITACDWVMLENCGLAADTVHWSQAEPEAMLHKSIGRTKSADTPAIACSYTVYPDGAYLGWALARFWGATNWISTLTPGLHEDPGDSKEEAQLIAPYNNRESQHDNTDLGRDVVELSLAFLRANKENGWKDAAGQEYWEHANRWSLALLERNIGYRFVLTPDFEDPQRLLAENAPLILDGCACLSDAQSRCLREYLRLGGRIWALPPLGTHTTDNERRKVAVLDELQTDKTAQCALVILDPKDGPNVLNNLIVSGAFTPRIRVIANNDWRIRLRQTTQGIVIHLLNQALEGVEHPTVKDRWGQAKVLKEIRSKASGAPLVFEVNFAGLRPASWSQAVVLSPELPDSRETHVEQIDQHRLRLTVDLTGVRLYAMLRAK